VKMLCIYRPTPGNESALLALVQQHWSVLHGVGLTTDEPAIVYTAIDKNTRKPFYVEIFAWRDAKSPELAHQMPEVMRIWEPMGPMIVGGRGPELALVEQVT
jgi:hypothetical protein